MNLIRNIIILIYQKVFDLFQIIGIHIIVKRFYSPIPDTRQIKNNEKLWLEESELIGIKKNITHSLYLLNTEFSKYRCEVKYPLAPTSKSYEYFVNNGNFGFISAVIYHCMIRHFRADTIIEVGSGYSTLVSARACLKNQSEGVNTKLIAIEPYPNEILTSRLKGLVQLIPKKVEDIELEYFNQLEEGDILFIDSSHVVRIGGDVNYLYLEVLPRLKKGVLIHIHDIYRY